MRESRLITLLQLQKPEGLQALMATYQAYVGTIIRNITRNSLSEQDVEELTADTFFAVWQTTDKLQAGKVRAYLAAIARNKAKSRLRFSIRNNSFRRRSNFIRNSRFGTRSGTYALI